MTYRSQSRGFMYSAPPGPDEETDNRQTEAEEADESVDAPAPELDPTTSATDANWTGTVSADD